MLIADREGWPILAVEYQGEGHFQGDAMGRDTVKRVALQRAGIKYLEVFPADPSEKIRARLREMLGLGAPRLRTAKNAPAVEATPAPSFGRAHAH